MTPGSRTLRPATAINKRQKSTVKGLKTPALAKDNNSRLLERRQNIRIPVSADNISVRDQNKPLVVPADSISVRDRNAETVAPAQNTAMRDSKSPAREPTTSAKSVSAASTSSNIPGAARSPRSSPASLAQGQPIAGDIFAAQSELNSILGAISNTQRTLRSFDSNRQGRRSTRQQLRPEAAQQESDTMTELRHDVKSEQDRLDKLFRQLDCMNAATEAHSKKPEHLQAKAKETHGATQRKDGVPESSAISTVNKRSETPTRSKQKKVSS